MIKSISEEKWKNLKSETMNTVVYILEAVEDLVANVNSNIALSSSSILMSAGLYTHAIEEYGKLLYLQSLIPNGGMVGIDYDGKFKNHRLKFQLALDSLSETSTTLHNGAFTRDAHTSDAHDVETVTDWEMRLNILNTDFHDDGTVKKYPTVDIENLKKAVKEFRNIINNTRP